MLSTAADWGTREPGQNMDLPRDRLNDTCGIRRKIVCHFARCQPMATKDLKPPQRGSVRNVTRLSFHEMVLRVRLGANTNGMRSPPRKTNQTSLELRAGERAEHLHTWLIPQSVR